MKLLKWLRNKLHGSADPEKVKVVDEIEREKSRLNGAMEKLSQNVDSVKKTRRQSRVSIAELLDDTLKALDRGKQ